MKKYIDAEKLKKHYSWWNNEQKDIFDTIIDNQPSVDVVEVVRCKDCKYFINREGKCYGQDIRAEEGYNCYKDENDFCSYGDRGCDK